MPGFGHGPFGHGPFGRADWARDVVRGNVPPLMLAQDEAAEGIFTSILVLAESALDPLFVKAREFPDVLHPGLSPSKFTDAVDVGVGTATRVTAAEDPEWGPYVSLDTGNSPLSGIGAGWRMESDGTVFEVLRVRKEEARIDLYGKVAPASYATYKFYAPELITALYSDHGVVPDRYHGDTFLRGDIDHCLRWMELKGTADGYAKRGRVAGFIVVVSQLWQVDASFIGLLAAGEYFEYPSGEGTYLTTVPPLMARYDDVVADFIEADHLARDIAAALTFNRVIVDVTSDPPPLTGTSEHLVELDGEVRAIGLLGRWMLTDADGNEFWLEREESDVEYVVVGRVTPVLGPCTVEYVAALAECCNWCPSHYVHVRITPTPELLASFPGTSGDATLRLRTKLEEVKPAHVEFARFVSSLTTTVGGGSVAITSSETNWTEAGTMHYDVNPADEFVPDSDAPYVSDTY